MKTRIRQINPEEKLFYGELAQFERLITQIYPSGICSIVSDSFDYWSVITKFLPILKSKILARNGKVVIRPDSGCPEDIICGTEREFGKGKTPEEKGSIECMWDIFSGTWSDQGYRILNEKIGLIYGDSITLRRAKEICERLIVKGFATTNIVFGVGSFTYTYNTRDTLGMAIKCTYTEVAGESQEIFKDPKTDNGMKKSAKGLTAVIKDDEGVLYLKDRATWEELQNCELKTVFKDGKLLVDHKLCDIRARLLSNLEK